MRSREKRTRAAATFECRLCGATLKTTGPGIMYYPKKAAAPIEHYCLDCWRDRPECATIRKEHGWHD